MFLLPGESEETYPFLGPLLRSAATRQRILDVDAASFSASVFLLVRLTERAPLSLCDRNMATKSAAEVMFCPSQGEDPSLSSLLRPMI